MLSRTSVGVVVAPLVMTLGCAKKPEPKPEPAPAVKPAPVAEPAATSPAGDPVKAAHAPGDRIFAAKGGALIQNFVGKAANAKAGAVVDTGAGVYYLEGIPEWPDEVVGKRIKVAGIVQRKKVAPDPKVGPNGEQSAGMVGTTSVIVAPKWKLFPKP